MAMIVRAMKASRNHHPRAQASVPAGQNSNTAMITMVAARLPSACHSAGPKRRPAESSIAVLRWFVWTRKI